MFSFNPNRPTTNKKSLKDKFLGLLDPTPISPTPDITPPNFFGKLKDIIMPEQPQGLISPAPNKKVEAMDIKEAIKPTVAPQPTVAPMATPTPMPVAPMPTPTPTQDKMARNPAVTKFKIDDTTKDAIFKATDKYQLPPTLLADIALQESSYDPQKKSDTSTAKGLFQFLDKTWDWLKEIKVVPKDADVNDPYANAMAAAWSIANGHLNWWDESQDVWKPLYSEDELAYYYRNKGK